MEPLGKLKLVLKHQHYLQPLNTTSLEQFDVILSLNRTLGRLSRKWPRLQGNGEVPSHYDIGNSRGVYGM